MASAAASNAAPGVAPSAARSAAASDAVAPNTAAPNASPNSLAGAPRPAPVPATRPAAATRGTTAGPATTVPSEIGQRAIRRHPGAAAAPQTRPAATTTGAGGETVVPAAPSLELPRVAAAMAVVLGLIFGLRWVMRRAFPSAGAARPSAAVQVLTRTVLSPRQQLMLVRVGRRLIVVGDSGGQMTSLSEITDPDEVAALVGQLKDEKLSAAGPAFGTLFGRMRRGMDAEDAPTADRDDSADGPDAVGADRPHPGEGDREDPEVASTRRELDGLRAKVRLIADQFNRT